MANLDAQKTAVYFIWIVGIVAALGAFLVFLNYLGTGNSRDVAGQALEVETPSASKWTSCLDQGNKIKLANDGDSFVKADTCVAGSITRVSCAEDQYGYFTYEYTAAQSCPTGKSCVEDNGIASCQ